VLDPAEVPRMSRDEAAAGAKAAFEAVFEHGPKIELDHHLVYHSRAFRLFLSPLPLPTANNLSN
jgi:hypothetical protein